MRNKGLKIFLTAFALLFITTLFNLKLTTKQGVDTVLTVKPIPLYLKGLSFLSRHYETRHLARSITRSESSDEKKIEALFKWTIKNIRHQPEDLPVIDDHHWHIIIRGYGGADQIDDVFSLLCAYNGFKSYYQLLNDRQGKRHPFAFVRVGDRWVVFDVCHQTWFLNKGSQWASLSELRRGEFSIIRHGDAPGMTFSEYAYLFRAVEFDISLLKRNLMQMPLSRIWIEIKG